MATKIKYSDDPAVKRQMNSDQIASDTEKYLARGGSITIGKGVGVSCDTNNDIGINFSSGLKLRSS